MSHKKVKEILKAFANTKRFRNNYLFRRSTIERARIYITGERTVRSTRIRYFFTVKRPNLGKKDLLRKKVGKFFGKGINYVGQPLTGGGASVTHAVANAVAASGSGIASLAGGGNAPGRKTTNQHHAVASVSAPSDDLANNRQAVRTLRGASAVLCTGFVDLDAAGVVGDLADGADEVWWAWLQPADDGAYRVLEILASKPDGGGENVGGINLSGTINGRTVKFD